MIFVISVIFKEKRNSLIDMCTHSLCPGDGYAEIHAEFMIYVEAVRRVVVYRHSARHSNLSDRHTKKP